MTDTHTIYDDIAKMLQELHGRFGNELFDDRRRLVSLMADKLPDARREIRVLGNIVDEGVPQKLLSSKRHLVGMEMDRAVDQLEAETGMRRDIAQGHVRALAHALGLGPPPSIYEDAGSNMPPVAPEPISQPDEWAGLSEPVKTDKQSDEQPELREEPDTLRRKKARKKDNTPKYLWWGMGVFLTLFVLYLIGDAETGDDVAQGSDYAGELTDYGVSEQAELQSNLGSPTPMSIPGAVRVTTDDVKLSLESDTPPLLVDVLASNHQTTLQGAVFVPSGGAPGNFNDNAQRDFSKALAKVSGGQKSRVLVFFCAGPSCWESYNAALRALHAGYTNIQWYRGGLAAWSAAQLPMGNTPAAQGSGANFSNGSSLSMVTPPSATVSPATAPPGAEAFLRNIYARYDANGDGVEVSQSVLTASTYRKVMAAGDPGLGAFEADPVCQCQDWDNIKVTGIKITSADANSSNAEVRFRDTSGPSRTVRYRLRHDGSGWRVEDVSLTGGQMLLATLQ